MNKILLFSFSSFFLIGCSSNTVVSPNPLKHKSQSKETNKLYLKYKQQELEKNNLKEKFNNNTISYNKNIGSFYELEEKIIEVGDLVTVHVLENVSSSISSEKTLAKADDSSYGTGVGVDSPTSNAANNGVGRKVASFINTKINPIADINFKTSKSSDFSGNGESSSKETFNTTISVFVIDKLNKHLFLISGQRKRYINGQYTYEKLTGIISDKNLNENNEINSDKIANLEITYEPTGDIREQTEQNLPSRLINKILF